MQLRGMTREGIFFKNIYTGKKGEIKIKSIYLYKFIIQILVWLLLKLIQN